MSIDIDKLLGILYETKPEDRRSANILLGGALLLSQQEGETESVEKLLATVDPTKLLDNLCLGLLMGTFAHKAHYPSWELARQRIADTIVQRHGMERARQMLLGFINPATPKKVARHEAALDNLLGVHPTMVRYEGQQG